MCVDANDMCMVMISNVCCSSMASVWSTKSKEGQNGKWGRAEVKARADAARGVQDSRRAGDKCKVLCDRNE